LTAVPLLKTDAHDIICIDNFVIVNYGGLYYPGQVKKMGNMDAFVSCMDILDCNLFHWPKRQDTCWYCFSDIIAIIPEPTKSDGEHYVLCADIYAQFSHFFKKY